MALEVTIRLDGQSERLAMQNPFGLFPFPLYHQMRTVEALQRSDLVINTYNTGTGKTRAAFLHLLNMPAKPGRNALIIAPTNELVRQHHADVAKFVEDQKLDWYVLPPIDAEELRAHRDRERQGENEYTRNSRVLDHIINDPRKYLNTNTGLKPFVMVTNPDLFYYCLYYSYGSDLDARNLFLDFVTRFDYIVIDEFHYYDAKQFANFLFFFALCRRFGYFDGERRICLLSATPGEAVRAYLQRLEELPNAPSEGRQFRWEEIRPDNEPPEAAECQTTPALSPLHLTLVAEQPSQPELPARIGTDIAAIQTRLAEGQDGVVLSGSMARIGEVQTTLRKAGLPDTKIGVITGAAGRAERNASKDKPLILATPTVDIGYNFGRSNKSRQSIDFLYGDARNAPELLQRIGRAGRVLGKDVTNETSDAVMCVPNRLVQAIIGTGKTDWNRAEFAAVVRETLSERSWTTAYLESWALLESFLPLYELKETLPTEELHYIEELFADIKAVFAPNSEVTAERLTAKIRAYKERKQLVEAVSSNKHDDYIDRLWKRAAKGYVRRRFWEDSEQEQFETYTKEKQQSIVNNCLYKRREHVLKYAQAGYERMHSLLSFRGSGIDIPCGVYDPDRWLPSGSEVCYYDLLHLLRHYDVRLLEWKQFAAVAGQKIERCDCYAKVERRAIPPHRLRLGFSATDLKLDDFKKRCCNYPVALQGMRLEGDGELPDGAGELLKGRWITGLITTWQKPAAMANALNWPELRAWPLRVVHKEGEAEFSIVIGATAFMAHAERQRLWRSRSEMEVQPFDQPREEPDDEEASTKEGE